MGNSETVEESVLYRTPMQVKEILVYNGNMYEFNSKAVYPICPRCDVSMEYDYQRYCSCCGQKLSWVHYKDAKLRYAGQKRTASET